MSRYRKIEVRTWSDEKFRSLSAIQPSGQALWFFLLSGPHTTAIPGLFRAGRAAMAEELDWEQEAFDEAFREVFQQGMAKADFKAKLVWLPRAIAHNKPESPNVVRGWRVELDLLPECDLKREAIEGIRRALECVGPSYAEAFDEVIEGRPKASAKASSKASAKTMANQEQEQEQEQEQDKYKKDTARKRAASPAPANAVQPPADVPETVWQDFLTLRKAKRAPLSDTALAGIRREAERAGIGLADALACCCESGWMAFKADWYADRQTSSRAGRSGGTRAGAASAGETAYQRSMRERVAEVAPSIARAAPSDSRPPGEFFRTVDVAVRVVPDDASGAKAVEVLP